MKLKIASRNHLDWNSGQPFFTGTLIFSLFLALAMHLAFFITFNIQDLIPRADRILPFIDVQAQLPDQDTNGVTLDLTHKYTSLLPKHPSKKPAAYIPEVKKPTFFPGAGRLIKTEEPVGKLESDEFDSYFTVTLSPEADKILDLKEDAQIPLLEKGYKTVSVMIDAKRGQLIPLRAKDAPLVLALQKQFTFSKSHPSSPFEETLTLQAYD
jgi:hypothetical protein